MKKIFLTILSASLLFSCSKDSLDLVNPNSPNPAVLKTEEGLTRGALGIYAKFGLEYWWLTLANHDIMGDAFTISAGNYSWRWINQVSKITLSDGTVLTPPQGGAQGTELKNRNDRSFGNDNAFYNEWAALYLVNNQANLLLDVTSKDDLTMSGSADAVTSKKALIRAFAYWWKGFVYSRIGSIYIAGVQADKFEGGTLLNSNFVTHDAIVKLGNDNFDACAAELNKVTNEDAYNALFARIIPGFTMGGKGGVISPAAWKRHLNTYKARNILANKKVAQMTSADWTNVLTLATAGLAKDDHIFTMRSYDVKDLVGITAWAPYRLLNGWDLPSERFVQDIKAGDKRYTRNVIGPVTPYGNERNRGAQYSTRWRLNDIRTGGDWVSTTIGMAEIPVGCSYEENELMIAEANIYLNNIEEGLKHVDNVRDYQKSGLPHVSGTGLSQADALEELRRERRIGLFLKNVAFYDARRWGITAAGGGRKHAWVVKPNNQVDTDATIEYNYLEYWDVPQNELDFNTPSSVSAPVKSN
ncbi:RagB/SusD family nutrient uptake outer membrane protein [Chitinophaga qingshengii]|uniref:RagB/SusD family nutrient uptake outer membrane protein n=1 Tax=Chitinophaga qingshengii TaxID=1569794 RepID=A0ABR7TWR3_9BACT|nr:RagB/SusD family nutrient uptake outer membrane protein [Chitinophaga qingshengii]MBC9933821.1 RagB/SusD family nutrient uptake outer membrane protein [Chitinophaga qingshengii]